MGHFGGHGLGALFFPEARKRVFRLRSSSTEMRARPRTEFCIGRRVRFLPVPQGRLWVIVSQPFADRREAHALVDRVRCQGAVRLMQNVSDAGGCARSTVLKEAAYLQMKAHPAIFMHLRASCAVILDLIFPEPI